MSDQSLTFTLSFTVSLPDPIEKKVFPSHGPDGEVVITTISPNGAPWTGVLKDGRGNLEKVPWLKGLNGSLVIIRSLEDLADASVLERAIFTLVRDELRTAGLAE